MYERFTDRARKVMQLASQQAQAYNHEYIGTEHILLGLLKENGVASAIIDCLGVDPLKVKAEVERFVYSGPDSITMGRLPQTPKAKKVVEYAIEASRFAGCDYVGTEHLLLGLLRETEGVAYKALQSCGITEDAVRERITVLFKKSSPSRVDQAAQKIAEILSALDSNEAFSAIVAAHDRLKGAPIEP